MKQYVLYSNRRSTVTPFMLLPTAYANLHALVETFTFVEQQKGPMFDSKNTSQKVPTELKAFNITIAKYFCDTRYQVDRLKSFSIINRQPNSTFVKLLGAIAIKRLKPDLCIQKEVVANLPLP